MSENDPGDLPFTPDDDEPDFPLADPEAVSTADEDSNGDDIYDESDDRPIRH
jgi:hypothetical protein